MIFQTIDEIMWLLILYLIFLVIMAIFLSIALGFISKAKHTNFGQVFLTSFLITVAFALIFYFLGDWGWFTWIVALLLAWLIVMVSHNIGFLAAVVVTILAFLIYVLVAIVLGMILNMTLIVLPF